MRKEHLPFFERFPLLRHIGNTPLIRIDLLESAPDFKVFAKLESMNPGGSIKDRPVLYMLLDAILSGKLTPDKCILDSSSGNAGIAYALIGGMLGYNVELVVPGNASLERKKRILAHGAKLTFTDPLEGYDEALRTCHRLYESNRNRYFLADQYSNDQNWRSHYETTAIEILEQTGGKLTHFVAGVGTGGTLTGVGRRLKEIDSKIQVIRICPDAFPGIEGLKPLENPNDIRPKILDESVIDEKIRITSEEAFDYCRKLARLGIFVGQSSGAYLAGAAQVARRGTKGQCVTIFSDTGERYFSTALWDEPIQRFIEKSSKI